MTSKEACKKTVTQELKTEMGGGKRLKTNVETWALADKEMRTKPSES